MEEKKELELNDIEFIELEEVEDLSVPLHCNNSHQLMGNNV